MDMAKRKKRPGQTAGQSITAGEALVARDLAKDIVIRAYFARRQKEREGLRGKIRSLFSRRKSAAPLVDMFEHLEKKNK